MKIVAEQKYIRVSPRKLRLVADVVRALKPLQALDHLSFINKAASEPLAKVIKQALANASHNFNLNENQVKFSEIQINEGPTFKRWRAVSRGRAHSVLKRTSHIRVVVEPTVVSSVKAATATPSQVTETKLEQAVKPTKTEEKATKPTKKAASNRVSTKKTTKTKSKNTKSTKA